MAMTQSPPLRLPEMAHWATLSVEMAGEARFSPEMAAARGLHGDPAEARRDSPDPGRRHDGRLHLAATVPRRPAAAAAVATQCTTLQCT